MTFFVLNVMLVSITGDPMIYTTRTAFDAAAPGLSIEGFEFETPDGFNGSTVDLGDFTVTERAFVGASFITHKHKDMTDGYVSKGNYALQFVYNGNEDHTGNVIDVSTLTFEFLSDINAFAVDILDFGTSRNYETKFFVEGRTSNETTVFSNVQAAVGPTNERGNIQFIGIATTMPFRKIVFTSVNEDTNDLINFDQVAFGTVAIPEPSAMLCMVIAGLFITAANRGLTRWKTGKIVVARNPRRSSTE